MITDELPVDIGQIVYLTLRDTVMDTEERYSICECEVSDVSRTHGFLIKDDDLNWKKYERIGKDIFYTIDEAMESIKNNDDYKGFVYSTVNNEKWLFTKRREVNLGDTYYRVKKEEKEKAEKYTIRAEKVTAISENKGFMLEDDKWIENIDMHADLFKDFMEAKDELRDQKDYEGFIFIDKHGERHERH